MTFLPGAASTSVRDLLSGPPRAGRVVGVHPSCAYVLTGPQLVALESADGLGLPCAVRLGADRAAAPFGDVRRGDPALVGDGTLTAGPLSARVARWWSPPRVRAGHSPARLGLLAGLLEGLPAPVAADLPAADLLGRGPGLTPAGDDVLAGWLLAVHHHEALRDPLVAVFDDLAARTTSLSAALLREAAEGRGLPAAVAVADSVAGHGAEGDLRVAVAALLAVGHSSGLALAYGILRGARAVAGMVGSPERMVVA
ncbi:MAG TPA: DUF2877 domain-containing protein [Actinomycetes bacterium]